MVVGAGVQERVLSRISRDRLVELTRALVDIPSPTGHEADVATYLVDYMKQVGLRAFVQEISPGRYNAVGTLPGRGGGLNLVFNGHLDTSYSGQEPLLVGGGYKTHSYILDDEWIYGAGVNNMKSAVAAYVEVARAIVEADVQLPGDIVIAGVAGEIEKGPVDEFQGCDYAGHGIGTIHLIRHGITGDYCIIGEPTSMRVVPWHMGTVWVAFRTRGTMAHTAWLDRAVNAIDESMLIYNALKEWIGPYRERNRYNGLAPNVNLSAIRGGWPWRVSRTPVYCDIFLDVRVNPRQRLVELKEELAGLLRDLKRRHPRLVADMEFYSTAPGTEVSEDTLVVEVVKRAHREVFGEAPEVEGVNFYSDAAHMNHYGIPTVNYGISGRLRSGGHGWDPNEGEHQSIGDLVTGARVYALAALDICSRARSSSLGAGARS